MLLELDPSKDERFHNSLVEIDMPLASFDGLGNVILQACSEQLGDLYESFQIDVRYLARKASDLLGVEVTC